MLGGMSTAVAGERNGVKKGFEGRPWFKINLVEVSLSLDYIVLFHFVLTELGHQKCHNMVYYNTDVCTRWP